MSVTTASPHRHTHGGRTFFFCGEKCRAKFAADPQRYPAPVPEGESSEPGTAYVCPMHPEIRRARPGTCPKCGMALEPELPSLDNEENPELTDFRRRFWWTLLLTLVVTTLAMFGHRLGLFTMATQTWIEFVLSMPVVVWAGLPFFQRWAQSIRNKSPNM
jgi:Cu+-exporting ATPase